MCPAFAAAAALPSLGGLQYELQVECSTECHLYSMLHRIIARICFSWPWALSHPAQPKGKKKVQRLFVPSQMMAQGESFPSFGIPSHGSISDPFLLGEFSCFSLGIAFFE
jgi:hypothetical protein